MTLNHDHDFALQAETEGVGAGAPNAGLTDAAQDFVAEMEPVILCESEGRLESMCSLAPFLVVCIGIERKFQELSGINARFLHVRESKVSDNPVSLWSIHGPAPSSPFRPRAGPVCVYPNAPGQPSNSPMFEARSAVNRAGFVHSEGRSGGKPARRRCR